MLSALLLYHLHLLYLLIPAKGAIIGGFSLIIVRQFFIVQSLTGITISRYLFAICIFFFVSLNATYSQQRIYDDFQFEYALSNPDAIASRALPQYSRYYYPFYKGFRSGKLVFQGPITHSCVDSYLQFDTLGYITILNLVNCNKADQKISQVYRLSFSYNEDHRIVREYRERITLQNADSIRDSYMLICYYDKNHIIDSCIYIDSRNKIGISDTVHSPGTEQRFLYLKDTSKKIYLTLKLYKNRIDTIEYRKLNVYPTVISEDFFPEGLLQFIPKKDIRNSRVLVTEVYDKVNNSYGFFYRDSNTLYYLYKLHENKNAHFEYSSLQTRGIIKQHLLSVDSPHDINPTNIHKIFKNKKYNLKEKDGNSIKIMFKIYSR